MNDRKPAESNQLERLALELEALANAHIRLGRLTARLASAAPPQDRQLLAAATAATQAAARTAAAASAEALAYSAPR